MNQAYDTDQKTYNDDYSIKFQNMYRLVEFEFIEIRKGLF
jgi:hypothetical protein